MYSERGREGGRELGLLQLQFLLLFTPSGLISLLSVSTCFSIFHFVMPFPFSICCSPASNHLDKNMVKKYVFSPILYFNKPAPSLEPKYALYSCLFLKSNYTSQPLGFQQSRSLTDTEEKQTALVVMRQTLNILSLSGPIVHAELLPLLLWPTTPHCKQLFPIHITILNYFGSKAYATSQLIMALHCSLAPICFCLLLCCSLFFQFLTNLYTRSQETRKLVILKIGKASFGCEDSPPPLFC